MGDVVGAGAVTTGGAALTSSARAATFEVPVHDQEIVRYAPPWSSTCRLPEPPASTWSLNSFAGGPGVTGLPVPPRITAPTNVLKEADEVSWLAKSSETVVNPVAAVCLGVPDTAPSPF